MAPLVRGKVMDSTGAPVTGAIVFFVNGPAQVPDVAQITGEDGDFALSAPVAGRYRLGVRSGEGQEDLDVEVEPGGSTEVQVRF